MFNGRNSLNLFSLPKVIGTMSKTLSAINQMIPIYKEAKPLISNAKSALNMLKSFGEYGSNRIINKSKENLNDIKKTIKIVENKEKGPTFFQ